ncbi:alpha-amylase family glycosyl hydrolase [Dyadobacter sp. MSC1_007]|jgi:alpha-amylase|uniref:alpha-amylase family glycosyl hydrolase n=1 Tax=Dyadobacter sp. MSC1_007 TaxID=2909264 RepID=UPI00202FF775|nr:alpha-amylase family glycosyl hydrolase [Dyadobacter sp. MSC1_007]
MIKDKSAPVPKICYEIFVRSFCDSNGDGIGDLNGIISQLDYLADLGIEALWLTPVHPSPSYHKYDVADYYDIDPEYGTIDDFKRLLAAAHDRGIAIYLDLIVNHTSTLHPWFSEAKKGPENAFRNFYWWKSESEIEALGISKRDISDDSQVVYPWHDNVNDEEKYYGLFYVGMPDLNYHSEELKEEIAKIIRFWLLEIGVDGFRLDAARHIYPEWEKDLSINFWEFFAKEIRECRPDAFTVAEVWAETEEVAPYFKYLNATFHFDLSFALQRMLIAERDEEIVEKLLASFALFEKYNPLFIDATMLTNHDQDRIGSVVGGHIGKIKLAASILLTLPGQPYLYYGEELGMLGTKPDPYIREPFLWSEHADDTRHTNWIEAHFSTPNTIAPLSEQMHDPESVFNHYKTLIRLRKSEPALAQIFAPNLHRICLHDDQMLAYFRPHVERSLVIIHNMSGYSKNLHLPEDKTGFTQIIFSTDPSHSGELAHETLAPYATLILAPTTGQPPAVTEQ